MRSFVAAISLACVLGIGIGTEAEAKSRRHGDGRPSAWCGWYMRQHFGMAEKALNLARNWAGVGHSAGGPRVGVIIVWRHHVGVITGQRDGKWIVKSGNDGGTVRERPRSIAGAIAFRVL